MGLQKHTSLHYSSTRCPHWPQPFKAHSSCTSCSPVLCTLLSPGQLLFALLSHIFYLHCATPSQISKTFCLLSYMNSSHRKHVTKVLFCKESIYSRIINLLLALSAAQLSLLVGFFKKYFYPSIFLLVSVVCSFTSHSSNPFFFF